MHTFNDVVGALVSPLMLSLLLALAGLALRWANRRRAASALFVSAGVLAWMLSTPLVGRWLLAPLEGQFPALESMPGEVRYIVVLGSSYTPQPGLPISAAHDEHGLRRVIEGLRLQNLKPDARLVFSGVHARGGEDLAKALLPPGPGLDSIQVVPGALNTHGEALDICDWLGHEPFVLVTSASHMPRAVRWMRVAGCNPIPAPTHQQAFPGMSVTALLLPGASGLRMSEDAFHEYLGWIALLIGMG
jgi:uncharacterized SAM-binding protein YcdF (DUF218 family)